VDIDNYKNFVLTASAVDLGFSSGLNVNTLEPQQYFIRDKVKSGPARLP